MKFSILATSNDHISRTGRLIGLVFDYTDVLRGQLIEWIYFWLDQSKMPPSWKIQMSMYL